MSIKEIAEMTGVSYSTVSRVLSNPNYRCSSEETRIRILEAARKLSYVPNESARNLKLGVKDGKSVFSVGIVVTAGESENTDTFCREMLTLIEREIHKSVCTFSRIWFHPEHDPSFSTEIGCRRVVKEMSGNSGKTPDGLIIIGRSSENFTNALKKHFKSIVSVSIDRTGYDIDEVTCSGKKTSCLAMNYLMKLGHKKIAYAGDTRKEQYFNGYYETLLSGNIEIRNEYIFEGVPSEKMGVDIIDTVLEYKDPPSAFFCSDDDIAIGILQALNGYKHRYYMPSVISCGDTEKARFTQPMLTTVHIPKEEISRFAVNLLLDRLLSGHSSTVKLDVNGKLVIRESCSTPDIAVGCEYII